MADNNPFRKSAPTTGGNPFRKDAAAASQDQPVTLDSLMAAHPSDLQHRVENGRQQMRALADPRLLGEIAQGLTLGGADEAIGGAAGLVTGRGYQAGVDTARQQNADFAAENPAIAAGAQIAGGAMLGVPAAGLIKSAPSLLGRIAQGAGLGAGAGGIAGFLSGEGGADNRLAGAENGAIFGGLLGGGIPAAGALLSRGADAVKTLFRLRPTDEQANRLIASAMRRDNLTPQTAQQTLDAAGGQPMAPADLGENLTRLLGSAYRAPGQGRAAISEVLDARGALRPQRLTEIVRRGFGNPEDFYTTIDDLKATRNANAQPLRERAMAVQVTPTDDLTRMLNDPIMRSGIARGREIQRIEAVANGTPVDDANFAITGFNDAGEPVIGQVPNMRVMDAAKQGLDAIIEDARDGVTGKINWNPRLVAIDKLRQNYVKALDVLNPQYAAYREAWAGPSQSMDALSLGRDMASSRGDLEPLLRRFNTLSDGDKDMARLGMSRELAEMINRGTESRNQALGLLSPQMRGRLEAVFPDRPSYEAMEDAVRREARMVGTDRSARGGSQTAERLNEDAAQVANLGDLAQAGEAVLSGSPVRMARTGLGILGRRAQGIDENVAKAIGQRLLATDPQARAQVMDELQRLMFTPKARTPLRGLLSAEAKVAAPGLLGMRMGEAANR